ncbi:MAG: hypothetical protein ACO1RT_08355 [Planctomycetaceae bacterium]
MNARVRTCFLLLAACLGVPAYAESAIHFDLPATAVAADVTPADFGSAERLVSIQFDLSLIVDALPAPQVEQLVVQVCPLGGSALVDDYSPRTELASQYAGAIEVSRSKEVTDHVGLSLDGSYAHFVQGSLGADRGEKNIDATKFSRVAPLHVVAASGTTHRGRGVYFKLRAGDQQVLEGDKSFTLVLKVPASWRGELIDFRVEAESMAKSFSTSLSSLAGVAPKSQVVGTARFIVATHLQGDGEMESLARQLAESESTMRQHAARSLRKVPTSSASSKLSYIAFRLDVSKLEPSISPAQIAGVVDRVIFGRVDPYVDPTISELSLPVRVAILDYLEAKDHYVAAATQ